jgi:hypothetical protein
MGGIISRNAGKKRIRDVAARTLAAARARGDEVKALAEARLAPLLETFDGLAQQLEQARATDDNLHAALMARDSESDLEIRAVCSEIWNALGRPAQSPDYDLIVGSGTKAWTDGDPAKQPHLMTVLAANIRGSKHPKLDDRKEAWAKRIDVCASAQAEAVKPTEAARAQITVLAMQGRAVIDSIQVALTRLKRDLKNIGMSEVQIHEVIPDVSSAAPPAPVPPAPPTPQAQ